MASRKLASLAWVIKREIATASTLAPTKIKIAKGIKKPAWCFITGEFVHLLGNIAHLNHLLHGDEVGTFGKGEHDGYRCVAIIGAVG